MSTVAFVGYGLESISSSRSHRLNYRQSQTHCAVNNQSSRSSIYRCGKNNRVASKLQMTATPSSSSKGPTVSVKVNKPVGLVLEEMKSGAVLVSSVTETGNASKSETKILRGDWLIEVKDESGTVTELRKAGLEKALESIQSSPGDSIEMVFERQELVEDGYNPGFDKKKMDPQMQNRLKKEISAPYRQNWILVIVAIVAVLVISSKVLVF
eukprot:CAMPEP_0182441094 /NCGR_PEP_ID=MMETSP1172-20130603/45_1 /TAXON_ID=708627 /ORGANISM="Timspurckia oligopyrenoides, Strain CCMP3278" /LENGTH=210 /DNA_ID=CAMNT_0024635239 /DNA_START=63 /DNA_END=695 /DNA_ORIENTATION=+